MAKQETKKETPKKAFLAQFAAFRKHHKKKQGEWAALADRNRETFTRAEHGQAPFLVDYLLNISEDLGIHPADIFCFNPKTKQVEYPSDAVHLNKIAQLEKTVALLFSRITQLEATAESRGGGVESPSRAAYPQPAE